MNIDDYRAFTRQLIENLQTYPEVLGFSAMGSMAEINRLPDAWSDHDFFVLTRDGHAESFRQNIDWLPDRENIVLNIRETQHGLKILYRSGHLLEFAVFDDNEFVDISVNDYAVLLDRTDIGARLAELQQRTEETAHGAEPEKDIAMFLALLLVGAGRCMRGEVLSGHLFIKSHALSHLLKAIAVYLPVEAQGRLDNLDSSRRFEQVYPVLGDQINGALLLEPIHCATELLAIGKTVLADHFPIDAMRVVEQYLNDCYAE